MRGIFILTICALLAGCGVRQGSYFEPPMVSALSEGSVTITQVSYSKSEGDRRGVQQVAVYACGNFNRRPKFVSDSVWIDPATPSIHLRRVHTYIFACIEGAY